MDVYFGHPSYPTPIIHKNIRNYNFSRVAGGGANINLSLDYSSTSKKIRSGWRIKVKHNGKYVFTGIIYKRNVSDNQEKISLVGIDLAGLVDRRNIYQLPNFSQEASTDVIEKLEGLTLFDGTKLKTDKFVEKTGTELAWHGEHISLGQYITEIAEKSTLLNGDSVPFDWWVTPNADVLFQPFGSNALHRDIPIKKKTMSDDITNTFNDITVMGLPLYKLPYDGDLWTEVSVDMWDTKENGSSVAVSMSSNFAYSGIQSVKFSFSGCSGSCLGQVLSLKKSLLYQGEGIVLENLQAVNFALLTTAGYLSWASYNVEFTGATGSFNYSDVIGLTGNNTWKAFSLSGSPLSTSGDGLLTPITSITIEIFMLDGGYSAGDLYFDNFYLDFIPYQYQTDDQDSIDEFTRLEKVLIGKEFTTNAECQTLAEDMLLKLKNAKETYNLSVDGFYDIYPNSTIEFEYEGEIKRKVVKSVSFYDEVDGSLAMQITVTDMFVKTFDEKTFEKFVEINRNTYLDANPYRIG